jgi:protein gp37
MAQSKIEWTEMTWNPPTGCDKLSAGCKFCYAEVMSRRLKAMGIEKYKDNFEVRTHEEELSTPYAWKSSKIVFVNSMSDLFHKKVPVEFIQKVFKVMNENPQHVFQVLTKRADLLLEYDKQNLLKWTHNIWMGVSVEDDRVVERIDLLRRTKAKTKFLSLEPLIGPLSNLKLKKIDWVIVGGKAAVTPDQ